MRVEGAWARHVCIRAGKKGAKEDRRARGGRVGEACIRGGKKGDSEDMGTLGFICNMCPPRQPAPSSDIYTARPPLTPPLPRSPSTPPSASPPAPPHSPDTPQT